jgi:hypothetical protein
MKGKRVKRVTLIYPIAKTFFSSKGLEFLTNNSQRNIQHAIVQNGEDFHSGSFAKLHHSILTHQHGHIKTFEAI